MPEITYFTKPGPSNTDATLSLAAERARKLSIGTIVLASSSGATALKALKLFEKNAIVCVTHSTGFEGKDIQELSPRRRKDLEKAGCRVLTCQHAFGGVNRAVRRILNTYQLDEILAYTLRTIGQGFKVCVEIALMAADAGLVSTKREALCIGGTGTGCDTAVILTPANAQSFFELKIHEIVCKPRL
jgi:uncharacterized protein